MPFPVAIPGRRERQVDSTRARLFEAAIVEFRRVGLARSSITRIARAAGLSRPTFYFHFPTKEHVLFELQYVEERALAERLERAGSLREALQQLTQGVVDLEARLGDTRLIRDVFSIYLQRPDGLPLDDQPFPIVVALARHFSEAAARGELRAGLEPEQAARVCLTGLFGLMIGLPDGPAQRSADFALHFSLYLAEEAR